ncbi:MAG: glycosyltransferase family 4 protein [Acidobacteria bacterium]|nr:glycosyltransferase family 4 protein [Acidobacteriota bacterium]
MRIAVDVRELCGRRTGVGRYLGELLQEWTTNRDARRHEWHLYAHERPSVPSAYANGIHVIPGAGGTAWEQWTLDRALTVARPDVLFAPAYTAPLTAPCPVALTIHDMSFSAHPEWFSWREGMRRRLLTRWSARRARVVITVSTFSKREIATHCGIPSDRIRVIGHGMRSWVAAPPRAREPLVLYVGSIFARRNVATLLQAFLDTVAPALPDARLAIVGDNRTYPRVDLDTLLARAPEEIRRRVALHAYASDDELAGLYASASAFVFLSEYEGFGFTPLEALAAGVPPVVLDTPIAREIYGPAARYLPPFPDLSRAVGEALVELLVAEAPRRDILRYAPEVLGRYLWDRAAADTLRAIEDAAGV